MNKEEFKNYVNEIAINELRNSFDNNLMETLNSAFIFKYVETLEKENKKYKEEIDKAIKLIEEEKERRNLRFLEMEVLDILKEVE